MLDQATRLKWYVEAVEKVLGRTLTDSELHLVVLDSFDLGDTLHEVLDLIAETVH